MRPIKFRAWDKERKKMVTDFVVDAHGVPQRIEEDQEATMRELNRGAIGADCYMIDYTDYYVIHNYEVMQFTGLLDKNAGEIYEGDILLTDEAGWKAKVIFQRGAFILVDNKGGFSVEPSWEKCEIIGNAHENPELLNPPSTPAEGLKP